MTPLEPETSVEGQVEATFSSERGARIVGVAIVRNVEREVFAVAKGPWEALRPAGRAV